MTKRMLIDAAHPEQIRVAVVDGTRVEEFDFESQSKIQLRGNIYLAKITRVEASLQAAFVDYGGNRHGFLAFNEIHPDYYQIPVEDRERLLREEEEAEKEEDEAALAREQQAAIADDDSDGDDDEAQASAQDDDDADTDGDDNDDTDEGEENAIAKDAAERRRKRRMREMRRYKIQEVIKSGQILLVQVVKEERGNKGAALTSYLSLAGRYCVLMPNTARGGGISRKISNASDRKRLKGITEKLSLPKGMGLIIRTAGSKRTKIEINRDYEYLGRLWSIIRERTMQSTAPALIHEEGSLVRRAVRDLYDKDIENIFIEGDSAYREAKDFMTMLMPSHAPRVKHYKDAAPLFLHFKVEDQLESIYQSTVQLRSGGYLIIDQTEALVAIDVNSGRSTKERNIEATALKTNLEAADEACRQMRLRDLAGLVVIDFIDMDENKHIRAVEKRMKDALKRDRARVQAGRISTFGLMELSRQRRRASVIESSTQKCPTCEGLGVIRSVESAALSALQGLEAEAMKGKTSLARLTAPTTVALYILNQKRAFLSAIEASMEMRILIEVDDTLHPPQYNIEALEKRKKALTRPTAQSTQKPKKDEAPLADNDKEENVDTATNDNADEAPAPKKRRRGRRGGRGRRKTQDQTQDQNVKENDGETQSTQDALQVIEPANDKEAVDDASPETQAPKPARRRRTHGKKPAAQDTDTAAAPEAATTAPAPAPAASEQSSDAAQESSSKPARKRRLSPSARKALEEKEAHAAAAKEEKAPQEEASDTDDTAQASKPARPKRRRRPAKKSQEDAGEVKTQAPETVAETDEKPKPKRRVRKRAPAAKPDAASATEKPAPSAAAPTEKPATEEPATEKPKRRPVRRRKPAAALADVKDELPAPQKKTENIAPAPNDEGKKRSKGWWARNFGRKED